MIKLYSHNQKAYDLAVNMLKDTKKAAIVHPTGTGKSFIAFKLCEDHPGKTICWLSLSEYIFSTQLENLYEATNGYKPNNIVFFTYAKLMGMSKEEIQAIHPNYIILDEYHRAGATFWQKGVEQLLFTYSDVPVLGLSATNIRYLDNQRDMAQELFDGNIASQMSLGEAIVRGILNPPKYILSMYYYQNTLEKYEIRVKKTKSKVVRDQAEKYLDELKRALENADGLDVIFKKHMSDPHGKYIVFCSNKEHMDQMMKHKEWFSKVDKEPHMYSVYSSDPGADKAFKDFKEDNANNHLRLLYCIDALNEGIHVDDINGVILLRPTVSPIVYKQQIGRALSASKKTNAVIFDIVLNIENLYSIDSVKEEMEVATSYYRSLGESEELMRNLNL
ncbi:DEAD/DEAH box helicase [Catenibacterium sp.]|uniref:DEAD/DEAH box helicase n=2 Tax=Catenibacterium sp. TaxID=2049022 RepID=UPI003FD8077E